MKGVVEGKGWAASLLKVVVSRGGGLSAQELTRATHRGTEEKLQLGGETRKSTEHDHHPFQPVPPPPPGPWPAGLLCRGSQDRGAPEPLAGLHPALSLGSGSSVCSDLGGKQGPGAGLCGCHGPWTPSVIRTVLALAWGFVTCLGP